MKYGAPKRRAIEPKTKLFDRSYEVTMEITVDKIREMFYYNRSNGMILARFSAPGKLPWRDAGTKSKNRYKIVSIGGIYISAHRLA